jgi:hypothetical protein
VKPDWGFAGTQVFTFSVTYTDAAGNPPAAGYPKVHIRDGAEIAGSPFPMAYVSGSYSSGAVFSYTTTLPAGTDSYGEIYSFFFEARDVDGFVVPWVPWRPSGCVRVDPLPLDLVRSKLALGDLLVAPNRLDGPGGSVWISMRGNPGGSTEVRIYDEAGAFVQSLKVGLDAQGFGSIEYRGFYANGGELKAGMYWALGVGGGVKAKRAFLVINHGGR